MSPQSIDQLGYEEVEALWSQVIWEMNIEEKTLFSKELLGLEKDYEYELSTVKLSDPTQQ